VAPPDDVDALVEGISAGATSSPDIEKSRALAKLFARDKNLAALRDILFEEAKPEVAVDTELWVDAVR
jgi:hypothetical protein